MIALIVAADEKNGIGKNNAMLWHLPNDFRFFKNTTWGSVIVMGRKTFESLGKALPGRTNIAITRQEGFIAENLLVTHSLQEGIDMAESLGFKTIFIGGGADVYKQALPIADRIYLTRVHATLDADVFFPEFNQDEFELVQQMDYETDARHAYAYSIQTWDRIAKTKQF